MGPFSRKFGEHSRKGRCRRFTWPRAALKRITIMIFKIMRRVRAECYCLTWRTWKKRKLRSISVLRCGVYYIIKKSALYNYFWEMAVYDYINILHYYFNMLPYKWGETKGCDPWLCDSLLMNKRTKHTAIFLYASLCNCDYFYYQYFINILSILLFNVCLILFSTFRSGLF